MDDAIALSDFFGKECLETILKMVSSDKSN